MLSRTMSQKLSEFEKLVRKLEAELPLIATTGRIVVGTNYVIWALRNEPDKVKAVVVAKNIPNQHFEKIAQIALTAKIPLIRVSKNSKELGELCKRPYGTLAIGVYDFGLSSLESTIKESKAL